MRASPDCYPCFLIQTLKTSRMFTSDEKKIRSILNEVSLAVTQFPSAASPPEISRNVYEIISRKTGVKDPYRKIKQRCNRQALSLLPEMRSLIAASRDRLLTAIKLSIAGNVIDFGANANFDLKKDIDRILSQELAINHYRQFQSALDKARRILYLADNAGETVFDRLLIEELRKPVVYAVREKPIINDALGEDALNAGIDEVAEIISSGSDAPGTILKFCSKEFLRIFRSAGLIISKGQGNYETLSGERRPIFFLLKAKCRVIAGEFGIKEGGIVLKMGT